MALLTISQVVDKITSLHRSLPPRPATDDLAAAEKLLGNDLDAEERLKLENLSSISKSPNVPEGLFVVYQQMEENLIKFQNRYRRRKIQNIIDLESLHRIFDESILKAREFVRSNGNGSSAVEQNNSEFASKNYDYLGGGTSSSVRSEEIIDDISYKMKGKQIIKSDGKNLANGPEKNNEEKDGKLSFMDLAMLIGSSAKKQTKELNLKNKLSDQVDLLPDTLGKLSELITLDLSENRIISLPIKIGTLFSLQRLDLHANRIEKLPDSIGDISNLLYLNLSGNYLSTLPPAIGNLKNVVELDLSSNKLVVLPDQIGYLSKLKKLVMDSNYVEELPYTIGNWSSLVELRLDYNQLKALPEALGKLATLQTLTLRYNDVLSLPTTMASLSNLRELNISFNQLETIPESLCLATALMKLNLGNNFANLTSLPRNFGNLENLEELDISNNQIKFLPDSFRALKNLRVLNAAENPLRVPPKDVAESKNSAQAVVEYMEKHVEKKKTILPVPRKKNWKSWLG